MYVYITYIYIKHTHYIHIFFFYDNSLKSICLRSKGTYCSEFKNKFSSFPLEFLTHVH